MVQELIRWEAFLSDVAKELLEQKRRRDIPHYAELAEQKWRVVDEIRERSGKLLLDAPQWQQTIVHEWAARRAIEGLEEQDRQLGRRRDYNWIVGAVMPLRRFAEQPGDISLTKHFRRQRHALSIIARDIPPPVQRQVHRQPLAVLAYGAV